MKRTAAEIALISLIVLLQELTLIRWMPVEVRVLAYFPNLILISAFLGLGLGCLRAERPPLRWLWPVSLLVLATTMIALSRIAFTQESVSEHLWLLYFDLPADHTVVHGVWQPILVAFVLSAATFVAPGQWLAQRLRSLQKQGDSLLGYSADLLGSLTGVVLFAVLAFRGTFPVVWFGVFLAAGAVLYRHSPRQFGLYLAVVIALEALIVTSERGGLYSPYYALSLGPSLPGETAILTNGSLHQIAMHTTGRPDVVSEKADQRLQPGYQIPFRYMQATPHRALVLGAGTGNDVATLLHEGVESIDAVEIDPYIAATGRQVHPDHPYASPKVRVITDDARSFLNHTSQRYDLIVFGTLDSMTRLSALSNVRLDNFIYTQDCLRAARAVLAPGGGIAMFFQVGSQYIDDRLVLMLTRTFDQVPLVYANQQRMFNRILMDGPLFDHVDGDARRARAAATQAALSALGVPTDNWPFLYLRERGLTAFYLMIMGAIALISLVGVFASSREMRTSIVAWKADGPMFLLGLAFLLLETRSVTAMNLLWGATWLTSAVVFGAILFVILLATLLVRSGKLGTRSGAIALVASLLIEYFLPPDSMLTSDVATRLAFSVAFVGAPIFFAGVVFATLFRDREQAATALGWNLLGAVAGGLLEFLSMVVGLKQLLLLALAAYIGAIVLLRPRLAIAREQTEP